MPVSVLSFCSRKPIGLVLLLLSVCTLWSPAGVEVSAYLEEVENQSASARIGSIFLHIDGNDFPTASPANPVYLRVEMPQDVVLSETLVAPNGDPIYLALSLPYQGFYNKTMAAPPDTLAIVRHVAGENAFWLRISHSTDCWVLNQGGGKEPPTPESEVTAYFGLAPLESLNYYMPLFQLDLTNLPFNTTNAATRGDPSDERQTLINIDLSASTYPLGTLLFGDVTSYATATGVETETDPSNITTGTQLSHPEVPETPLAIVGGNQPPIGELLVDATPTILTSGGSCEMTGTMNVVTFGDTFPNASVADPTFVRVNLSNGARLCETRVDPLDGDDPIYLAMAALSPIGGSNFSAPPDTLSIVRWVAGEDAIWLKIQHPSSTWFSGAAGPDLVVFSLGLSGAASFSRFDPQFQKGHANLPANTTDLTSMTPVDTDLAADLTAANLNPFSPDLWAEFRSYTGSQGVTTSPDPTGIQQGSSIGVGGAAIIGQLTAGQQPGASITLSTASQQINPSGTCETTGDLSFSINQDLFPSASLNDPIYLEVALPTGATLCETRVDPSNPQPILLALSLQSPVSPGNIIAPPDTLAIVRWVAGESSIWLRVQHSSSSWVTDELSRIGPPRVDEPVTFNIGIDGDTTWGLNNYLYTNGKANMPANSVSAAPSSPSQASNTEITVDVTNLTMEPDPSGNNPWQAYFTVRPEARIGANGVETAVDPAGIIRGSLFLVSFQGNMDIAFGVILTAWPPTLVQGLEIVSMDALVGDDVIPLDYIWSNDLTGDVLSFSDSVIFEPIPTDSIRIKLTMRDSQGRTSVTYADLIVNPLTMDLNGDGVNNILDLYFALPQWGQTRDILFLLSIPY